MHDCLSFTSSYDVRSFGAARRAVAVAGQPRVIVLGSRTWRLRAGRRLWLAPVLLR
jgi:hypothetical protein